MRMAVIALLFAPSIASADIPPAPASPEVKKIATSVAHSVESNNVHSYAEMLSPDLQVLENGKTVATSKAEWLEKFSDKLSRAGVKFKIERVLASNNNFVIVYHFDSRGSFAVGQQECCQFYEISRYSIMQNKVYQINTFTTGNLDLTPDVKIRK